MFQANLERLQAALVLGLAEGILPSVFELLGTTDRIDDATLRHSDLARLVCAN